VIQRELLAGARLACTPRDDAPADRGDMLTAGEVHTLNEGRVDVPTQRRQDLLDSGQGAEDHPVADTNQASAPVRFDHLGIAQLRYGHPARLGHGACGLPSRWRHPMTHVGPQCHGVFPESIRAQQGAPVGRQDLHNLLHQALRQRPCTAPAVDGSEPLADRIDGHPDPMGGA
jgi:hypothetical protein